MTTASNSPVVQPTPPRKRKRWPWIVGAVVVIIGIAVAAGRGGGTSSETAAPGTTSASAAVESAPEASPPDAPVEVPVVAPPAVPPIGTPIPYTWSLFGSDDDQGVATVHTAEWSTEPTQFGGPPENGAFLIIEVTVESTKGTVSANPLDWQAQDADGRTYTYAFDSLKEPALSSGQVAAGQKSRGYVTIDAPQVPLTVQLVQIGSPPVASWAVPAA